MKKIIMLSILSMGVVFLTGCGSQPAKQTQPATPADETSKATDNQNATPTENPATADETANWKTYSNAKYGFEIQYPNNWTILHEGYYRETAPYEVSFSPKDLEGPYMAPISIIISTQNPEEDYCGDGRNLISKSEVVIDNIKTQKVICDNGPEGEYGHVYVPLKNNLIYELVYANPEWKLVFNQMISTFKFTTENPATADETANWKTYTNSIYGYSIKYPSTWKVSENNNQINLMPIDGQDTVMSFNVYDKSISDAEASLPILSVPGRKVDSRANVTVNGINWVKLIIETNQVAQLTYKDGKTYAAQYSTFEDISQSIISTFKLTNN